MSIKYENSRPNIPAEVRRSVEIESGHQCAIKGCFEHTYLEIHHIDNNRENNDVGNLILLCDKHHKMAHANVIDRKSLHEYKNLNLNTTLSNPKAGISESNSSLGIVDIYELEGVDDVEYQATAIEVKLRNSGSEVVFLKEVIFETKNHWELITDRHHSLVGVSAHYDVDISKAVGHRSKIKVHQEIKPQEADRIHIRLSTNYDSDPDGLSLFLVTIEFVFNEDSSKAFSGPVILNIRPKVQSRGSYFPCYSAGTINKNKGIAREVIDLHSSGAKVDEYVINALNSWISAPSEDEYFDGIRDT